MSRLLLVTGAALMVVFAAGISFAGDYHMGDTGFCSDCHTMHFSRSHDMSGGSGDATWKLGSGPNEYLLKNNPNHLCLACHDDQPGIPDVLGSDINGVTGGRSAGAMNRVGGVPGYPEWTGHTLGSTAQAPGGTWAHAGAGLDCLDCHSGHGRGSGFRNLFVENGGASITVSYAKGSQSQAGKDVYEAWTPPAPGQPDDLNLHYGQDNVNLIEPDQTKSGAAAFCKSCHTNFHGDKGGIEVGGTAAGEWIRHPNSNCDIGGLGGGHSQLSRYADRLYRIRVMSAAGQGWGVQGQKWAGAPTNLTPTCLSCHKAHGNKHAFGLILATGTQPIGEDGDSDDTRMTCTQCHKQGGNST